jgi:uncharacterized protein (DUF1501 family)
MKDDCIHCAEFSRAELVRRAAQAGRGLPAVEPGMPLPAGTGLDRRSFLLGSAGLGLAVYGGGRLLPAALEAGVARAAALASPQQRILLSVFLQGGADSLSILFPDGDPKYRTLRTTLAIPAEQGLAFPWDPRLLWHPALQPLATLQSEGKLAVLPAVGYTHPDLSHFTSRHFWEVGATDAALQTGWLGRYLDQTGANDNPLQGLALDNQLQPSLAAAKAPIAALDGPERYTFETTGVGGDVQTRMLDAIGSLGAMKQTDAAMQTAGEVAARVATMRVQLAPFAPKTTGTNGISSPVPYPSSADPFPRRFAGLAAMLAAGLPLRVVTITAPGQFDTHADQPTALTNGLTLTASSLLAFQRDLEARGLADRVLTLVWSEFGRRGPQNGSNGTDHGAAGTAFVFGTRVKPGLVGEFPGLATGLDAQGNLIPTSDFRALYCALLEQWLGADATPVIPGATGFTRPQIVA